MKTNPYVAVHCLKDLSLRIIRRPLKIIFIKGPVSKLHFKISAFTEHLPLKVLDFSKEMSLLCSVLGKAITRQKSYFRMPSSQTLLF